MEEFKKKGYYPAGGRSQTSSAGSITYINTDSGLTAGNVQDAIDEVTVDFVVEQGTTTTTLTSGETQNWHYTKWNSGKLEAWTELSYSNIPCTTAFGSVYTTDAISEKYPDMFVDIWNMHLSKIAGTVGWIEVGTGRNFTTHTLPNFYIVRGSSQATISFFVAVTVTGTWK